MNVIARLLFVLAIGSLAACTTHPLIGYPGYGAPPAAASYQRHDVETIPVGHYPLVLNPDRTWTAQMGSPPEGASAIGYFGHDKMWRVSVDGGPFRAVPDRMVVMNHPPRGFGTMAPYQGTYPVDLGIAPFPGVSAELAKLILADIDKGKDPCTSSEKRSSMTAFSFITGLATFALTGDAGIGLGVGLLSSLGASDRAQWTCDFHRRFRWSLMATIEAAKPRCLETLKQRQINGVLHETLTRDCAAIEEKVFKRIGEVQSPTTPASAPAPLAPRPAPARPASPARSWDGTGTPPAWVK